MRRVVVALLVLLAALPACARGDGRGGGDDRPRVVAAAYPLVHLAERLGTGRLHVTNLTPAGAEPHDLELTPDQADDLLDADLVLYLGAGFQPGVERIASRRGDAALDVLEGIGTIPGDPHVWLDPVRWSGVVDRVERAIVRADQPGEATYYANAARLRGDLAALDREFAEGLRTCDRRVIVASHAAFGYLAERYGLEQQAVSGLSPEAEPDPGRLADLTDLVRRTGATTVFTESLVSPKAAEALAREAGVKTAVLDPLEGLSEQDAAKGEDYFSVMRRNLATLREALGCQ